MRRQFDPAEPELMDRPQPVSRELEIDLRNLRSLNRYFGSYALIDFFLRRWLRAGQTVRILDLATGSGDIPRFVVDRARSRGVSVKITALDQGESTLTIARGLSAGYPEIEFRCANLLAIAPTEKWDLVVCSLALHHFGEDDAVRVLTLARELSHRFVLVADLRRGLLATAGVYLLTALVYREPMTRVDGRLSAARAFSAAEFRALAKRAGWGNFHHRNFRFARQAIWSEPEAARAR